MFVWSRHQAEEIKRDTSQLQKEDVTTKDKQK